MRRGISFRKHNAPTYTWRPFPITWIKLNGQIVGKIQPPGYYNYGLGAGYGEPWTVWLTVACSRSSMGWTDERIGTFDSEEKAREYIKSNESLISSMRLYACLKKDQGWVWQPIPQVGTV